MLHKIALPFLICVLSQGCTNNIKQESPPQLTEANPVIINQLPADDLSTRKRQQWQALMAQSVANTKVNNENSASVSIKQFSAGDPRIKNEVAPSRSQIQSTNSLQSVRGGNYMTLTPTGRTNSLGNPLYQIGLYANGQFVGTYFAVSGRAYTQNRNRNQSGTQAPLPDGMYRVARSAVSGSNPEVGGRFLPIQPLFRTGRTALGIHYDPSFEKNNGEDGTEGCIALTNRWELDDLLNYIRTYQPEYLEVKLQQ